MLCVAGRFDDTTVKFNSVSWTDQVNYDYICMYRLEPG